MKVELDFSNYATKADLKNATEVDTSSFAEKTDLATLKSNGDKLDIDKLIVGTGGHTSPPPPFLRFPLSRNPRCPHLS